MKVEDLRVGMYVNVRGYGYKMEIVQIYSGLNQVTLRYRNFFLTTSVDNVN